jgi:hypothetical protein
MASIEGSIYQNKEQNKEQQKEHGIVHEVVISGRSRVLLRGSEKL